MKTRRTVVALMALSLQAIAAADPSNVCEPSNPDAMYVDNLDGTATDIRTGLMWKRCVEGAELNSESCLGKPSWFTWTGALEVAQSSRYAGYADWRVPNLKELTSLVEPCGGPYGSETNATLFPKTPDDLHWTSSVSTSSSWSAWVVSFGSSFSAVRPWDSSQRVRLVRDAEAVSP